MFFVMTQEDTTAYRRRQAFKTACYTTLILCISLIAGEYVLRFFGIDLDDLRIAGGVLIAATAWNMLKNTSRVTDSEHSAAQDKIDISLTPMATPILSGPGAMSLAIGLISYGNAPIDYAGYLAGFLAIGLITWISLHYSDVFARIMSVNALGALNRILGLFIMAIGVNLIVAGLRGQFFATPA